MSMDNVDKSTLCWFDHKLTTLPALTTSNLLVTDGKVVCRVRDILKAQVSTVRRDSELGQLAVTSVTIQFTIVFDAHILATGNGCDSDNGSCWG